MRPVPFIPRLSDGKVEVTLFHREGIELMTPDRRRFLKLGATGLAASAAPSTLLSTTLSASPAQAESSPAQPRPPGRFHGKVVAITGATSGIGAAAARLFAAEGARVTFCGRRTALGRQVQEEITRQGGQALYIEADVTRPEQVRAFIDKTLDHHGRLDVGYNNAGEVLFKPLHQLTLEDWEHIHHTNLRGVFLAMKYQIPPLLESGAGRIVITSSQHAYATRPGGAAYASSKAALEALAQSATLDYADQGLRACVVAPGITDTPMFRRATGSNPEAVARANQLVRGVRRVASAEEVAKVAVWLASDDASYVTGTSFLVDGGLLSGFA
ncbi:SDR family oxidoreductase [Alloalcanivorax xenomutans]|uniref:SDR family NAD(P)-dependent oxidoreductase n=1 Tax=Alloalcanivorax xenomutans TaxID=1094342 RepID=UPI0024E25169|nr:SDR family NAD(P)-dependent oxidoreductase [Alloalcanivorax xenomutans]WOD30120.1 SDR family NAD(P)-dependent oxidoreductase [Alloalcanivorax xenomutans]